MKSTVRYNRSINPAVDTASSRKLLVQRIAGSRHFKRSARLQDLLLYLTDRVENGVTEIHEQEVGHEVFGRPKDYDTGSDNIVRVHASMLRKRLDQYFEEAADEPVTIEIPKGNYAPVFRARAPKPVVEIPLREPAPPPTVAPPSRLTWALGALAVLFAASTVFLLLRLPAARSLRTEAGPNVALFWSQLFRPGAVTDIVVDDASVGVYQDVTGRPLKLADYFDRDYLRNLGPREDHLPEILLRRHTSYAVTTFLFKLLQLPGDHSRGVLHFARDYTFRELRANHAILLGTSRTNPWIEPFDPKLGLRWTFDVAAGLYRPNDTFAAGKQYGAGDAGASRESYCGIALLPNLGGSGNVLIVSGTGGSAISTRADFLSDEENVASLRRLLGAKDQVFPPFEALIQANGRSAQARDRKIVFARPPRL